MDPYLENKNINNLIIRQNTEQCQHFPFHCLQSLFSHPNILIYIDRIQYISYLEDCNILLSSRLNTLISILEFSYI